MTSELGPHAAHAVIGAALGDVDLAALGPLTLRVGQRLLAEVLAIRAETDRMILSIAGRRLEAQVPPGIRQGDVVRLVVAEVLPDRVVFRLDGMPSEPPPAGAASTAQRAPAQPAAAHTQSAAAPLQTAFASAAAAPLPPTADRLNPARRAATPPLDAARVLAELEQPDSPEARAVVHALVERRQALTRESIQQLRAALGGLDGDAELNARAAVRLREDGLPLTPRAIQLARTALAPGTSAPIGLLLGELVSTLRGALGTRTPTSLVDQPGAPAEAAEVSSDDAGAPAPRPAGDSAAARAMGLAVTGPTARELQRVVSLFTAAPEALLSEDVPAQRAPTASPAPGADPARLNARTLLLTIPADGAPAAPPATTAPTAPAGPPAASSPQAMPADADVMPPVPGTLLTSPSEGPAPVSVSVRELVTILHDRIELDQLRAAAVLRAEAQPASASAGGADPTAAAPPAAPAPQLPLHPIALSVPLAIGGQFATLQLVVQRDGEGAGPERDAGPPAVRASFTLHLRHLGEVGADVRLRGPQVRCRLRAPSPAVEQRLTAEIDALKERLQTVGLDVRQLEVSGAGAVASPPESGPLSLRHVAVEA